MGLLKAGFGALGGTLADQWKEFFYCDALDKDVLVAKGQKRVSGRSSKVLCSRCHLYLFSFPSLDQRLCRVTGGVPAHLLRTVFSDCSSKSVIRASSAMRLSASRTLCG